MKDLIIIGAGDFGREISNIVERINAAGTDQWNLLGFVDDAPTMQGKTVDHYPVLGSCDWLKNYPKEIYAICSLGVSATRKKVISKLCGVNIKWATLIDPDARVYRDAEVGEGSVICGGSILAINAKVRKHVVMNLNCTLGHDSIVNDYSVINPGVNVSGKVQIGQCVDLGTGTKIIQGHSICDDVTVGAGGVVVKDINEIGTYVGVPVKKIK